MMLGVAPTAGRQRLIARVVNHGTIYATCALLATVLFWAQAPGWTYGAVILCSGLFFLYDTEDRLDRMFWTQVAHGLHARALMRRPVQRLPLEPCPPALLAAVKRFDPYASPIFVAESDAESLAVLDWTTWDQPEQDYHFLIAVDLAGNVTATKFFSAWPKAWGSRR